MADCINSEFECDRGATCTSPQFFEVEETLPEDITAECIRDGIEDGTYTPVKLSDYTFQGQLRKDYNATKYIDLDLEIHTVTLDDFSYDFEYMTFTIDADITKDWDNKEHTRKFDIFRTDPSNDDEVSVWVKGSIRVLPTITELQA